MFPFFRRRKKSVAGIDADTFSAALIELSPAEESFRVESYVNGWLTRAKDINSAGSDGIADPADAAPLLGSLVKKAGMTGHNAVAAVPVSGVITGRLKLDAALSDSEMETQVTLEAERLIPYPIDEVALDFEVDDADEEETGEKQNVTLVACRKQTVDARETLMSLAGLNPSAVDVVSYAMERAAVFAMAGIDLPSPDSPVALVHMGDDFITFNVMSGGKSIYVRNRPFGSRRLIESICQHSGCEVPEALERCRSRDYPAGTEKGFCSQGAGQVNRMLEQYYSAVHEAPVSHMLVAGDLCVTPGLCRTLEEVTGLPCSPANPFKEMKLSAKLNREDLERVAPAFFVACGLAARDVP